VVVVKKKVKDFEVNFEKEHGHKVAAVILFYCWMFVYF